MRGASIKLRNEFRGREVSEESAREGSRLRETIGVGGPNWTICRLESRVAPHG